MPAHSRPLRRVAAAVAFAALAASTASLAQPARNPAPGKPPAAAEPAPQMVPCRTAGETCFLGIVVGGQVAVLFTNASNAKGIEAKPVPAAKADGSKIDLASNEGRVVMLTGSYDPATGIKGADLVEVASPLASLVVKAQILSGGGEEAGRAGPRRR